MSDAVDRLNAALEGRYRIERELGEGGMATVYLAEDVKHRRSVALKVLKPELAAVVGAERFLAEIETTASLQHPNVLPLFDSGEADGNLFYVMPYVDGPTLRDRLNREKQLPVDEAVRIASEVAEALDHAHRHGIIHRDIKPGNILLRDGRPLVADFGIALALGAAVGERLTETGLSLGTPHYMSPEQATGDREIRASADIYALGCVLHEMLIGEPPFTGASAQAVLARILAGPAESIASQRRTVPSHVDAAIARALERLPADRFASATSFAEALNDPGFRYGPAAPLASVRGGPWKAITLVLGVVALILGGALLSTLVRREPTGPVERISVFLGEGQELRHFRSFDVSADGETFVYQGPGEANLGFQLWVRRWDELEPRPLVGADGVRPAISPDGTEVAFFRGGIGSSALVVVPIEGGLERTLVPTDVRCCDLTWSLDGAWIHFTLDEGLARIPAQGGDIEIVASLDSPSGYPRLAELDILPGGRTGVLIRWAERFSDPWVMSVDLETGETADLVPGLRPRYRDGFLFFADQSTTSLMAAPFDPETMELTGSPLSVVEGMTTGRYAYPRYALSRTGTLIYATGNDRRAVPVTVDRFGRAEVIDPDWDLGGNGSWWRVALSPDDSRFAVSAMRPDRTIDHNETDIYVHTFGAGRQRVTVTGRRNYVTGWFSPDSLIFSRYDVDGGQVSWDIRHVRRDSPGESTVAFVPDELGLDADGYVTAFYSPDRSWMVYSTVQDIHARPLIEGGGEGSRSIVNTDFGEGGAVLSPDGRWLAYHSDVSGQVEVYVRPFPDGEGVTMVSTGGGSAPIWRRDGGELYYGTAQPAEGAEGFLMAVPVDTSDGFTQGEPAPLFPLSGFVRIGGTARPLFYDATRDGQRFVMAQAVSTGPQQIIRVENFLEEVKARFDG